MSDPRPRGLQLVWWWHDPSCWRIEWWRDTGGLRHIYRWRMMLGPLEIRRWNRPYQQPPGDDPLIDIISPGSILKDRRQG